MTLNDFLKSKSQEELDQLMASCPTSLGNLWQIGYGHGACSPRLARAISEWTAWSVTPHEIAPNHYPYPKDGLPPEKTKAA